MFHQVQKFFDPVQGHNFTGDLNVSLETDTQEKSVDSCKKSISLFLPVVQLKGEIHIAPQGNAYHGSVAPLSHET